MLNVAAVVMRLRAGSSKLRALSQWPSRGVDAVTMAPEVSSIAIELEETAVQLEKEYPRGAGKMLPECPSCGGLGTPIGNKGLAACERRECRVATFFFD